MDRQLLLNITEFELDAMSNNIFILYSYTLKKWLHYMKRKLSKFQNNHASFDELCYSLINNPSD